MNRGLKKQIAKAFDAPAPRDKAQFVRSLPRPHISTKAFIFSQIPFIKKSIWLLSVLIVLPAVWGASFASENTVWIVSAFTPFLALLLITESAKSTLYGMNELEMASRFSLKNIVLARLTILGIFNFAIFCIIIPICHIANSISLVQTGVYLFVPYLLTTSISLYIVRHFRNKEAIYGCMAVAVCEQKLLGKSRFEELLAAYIEKPQGKPTLVPESDKRPAMNTAKNDFMEEYDNE